MKAKLLVSGLTLMMVVLFTMTACQTITQGEVIDKKFTPAYTTTRWVPMIISDRKYHKTRYYPYIYYYPDKWEITIQAWDEKENKMLTATYQVKEAVYNDVEIGAEFIYQPDYEPDTPEYTRERSDVYE